jgi:hypothetical protein
MRAIRVHVWAEIALVAVGAFLIGLFVLGGTAQSLIVVASVLVFLFAVVRALDSETYRKRDTDIPSPPGSAGPPSGPWA